MPGPLYARYVPPKKVEKPITQPQTDISVDGAIQKNSLYARYVPPKRSNRSAKAIQLAQASSDENRATVIDQSTSVEKPESKSKSKKRKREGNGTHDGKTSNTNEKKHKIRAVEAANKDGNSESVKHKNDKKKKRKSKEGETAEEEEEKIDNEAQGGELDVDSIFAKYSVTGGKKRASAAAKSGDDGRDSPASAEDTDEESDVDAAAGAEAVFAKYRKALTLSQKRQKKSKKENENSDEASPEPELHDLVPLPQPAKTPRTPYQATFTSLPSWISKPRAIESNESISFSDLSLSKRLSENLARRDLKNATAVQSGVLPLLLPGPENYLGDICVSAPTGSGKTLAYILPMVENIHDLAMTCLRGVIVVPTRELVIQAREVAEMCAAGTGVKIGTAVGNVALASEQSLLISKTQQYDPIAAAKMHQEAEEKIQLGYDNDDELLSSIISLLPNHVPEYNFNVDILICTPGRLVDHIRSTPGFTLRDVEWLVIDEADRLIDQNFQGWVDVVLPALEYGGQPTARDSLLATMEEQIEPKRVQKIILSATMTRDLSKLASLRLNRPTLVAIVETEKNGEDGNQSTNQGAILPSSLTESAVPVGDGSEKPVFLLHLLQEYLKISQHHKEGVASTSTSNVLIFTRSDDNATRLRYLLALMHPPFDEIMATHIKAGVSKETSKILSAFRRGRTRILISTDRASRGLDVEDMTYVVNYDVPSSVTAYVHRVGRTARAGRPGMAWTLYTNTEARWFWKTVCEGSEIVRGTRSVERVRFKPEELTEDMRTKYQNALRGLEGAVHGRVKE